MLLERDAVWREESEGRVERRGAGRRGREQRERGNQLGRDGYLRVAGNSKSAQDSCRKGGGHAQGGETGGVRLEADRTPGTGCLRSLSSLIKMEGGMKERTSHQHRTPVPRVVVPGLANPHAARVAVPERVVLVLAEVLLLDDLPFDEGRLKNDHERVGARRDEVPGDVDAACDGGQRLRKVIEHKN